MKYDIHGEGIHGKGTRIERGQTGKGEERYNIHGEGTNTER